MCDDKSRETNCTIKDWLKYGAQKEDDYRYASLSPSFRMLYHFDDPISGLGLNEPWIDELNVYLDFYFDKNLIPQATVEWAQDADNQTTEPLQGNQSWQTLHMLYYLALTLEDEAARKETFAQLFKGLGHQLHLLQDMAVPLHEVIQGQTYSITYNIYFSTDGNGIWKIDRF